MKKEKVIVIGGGPAGMMAALTAAENAEVVLVEQNEKLGKKLYITGKGRCNVTNDCPPAEFLENCPRGAKFLRGALYGFPPADTVALLNENGLKTVTERGNRVFPESEKASDVTKTLEKILRARNVEICLNNRVAAITVAGGRVTGVKTGGASQQTLAADRVIVATGGLSYPATGSTGDGYGFAKTLGHTVIQPVPALTGIETDKKYLNELQGLSLKNVEVIVKHKGKEVARDSGEMLFTHYGISGPAVLSLSSRVSRLPAKELTAAIDLKPALDPAKLDARILRDFSENQNKAFKNSLDGLLPKSLISVIISYSGIDGEKKINQITAAERKRFAETLKGLEFSVTGLRGFEEAIVTSGGVDLAQLDPRTMESKLIKGLHFAGEVIDADALTGGFNIQIALSTGYLAGRAAAADGSESH